MVAQHYIFICFFIRCKYFTGNIEIDVASGDPAIILDTQGADKFQNAVDDSDSDNLVIKSGGTVGSGSGLKLDSSGNLTIDGNAI